MYGLNDINTDHISKMEISMPVTLYKLEYDAVVSDELFDPTYPDAGYAVDRRENEKEIRIDDYTVIITYEFEYYSKEEVVTR